MKGKLNLFQATMVRWRALHPYNAVHAVRLPLALDASRLEACIASTLNACGLSGLEIDCEHGRFEFRGGTPTVNLRTVEAGPDPRETLRREFEAEINAGFGSTPALDPFRFFAVDAGSQFYFGLTYDHFIAGGDSIVELLKRIVLAYSGPDSAADAVRVEPWSLYPATYSRLFRRRFGSLVAGLPRWPRLIGACRHAFRPRRFSAADAHNAVLLFGVDAARTRALLAACDRWRVTLNDLLLAALLLALMPLTEARCGERRRGGVAVASIMNIRRELASGPRETFGQFLGSLQISHALPRGISLEELARDVNAQTSEIRRRRLYLQTLLALAFNGWVWRFLSAEQRHAFYAKHYPVWAGISTLNVKRQWPPAEHGLDYLRVASTGPLAPMVVAVTVGHEELEVGITYRLGVVKPAAVDAMVSSFTNTVESLCT